MNDIEKLYALQLIDSQRLRIIRQVKNLLEQTREPQDLVDLRSKVASMQEEQEHLSTNQKAADAQVNIVKEKIEANQQVLTQGAITDPREISTLQTKINELEVNKAALEERALAALLEYEDNNKVFQPLNERLKSRQSEWEQAKNEFRELQVEMAAEMEELNKKRRDHANRVDESSLRTYEDLLRRKNGIAVTTISNSSCDACFMSLPISVATAPPNNDSYLNCPSCGRILVQR